MRARTVPLLVLVSLSFSSGCGSSSGELELAEETSALCDQNVDVQFGDCSEFAGIGFIPRENAVALVPAEYVLAGANEQAVVVVRAAQCARIAVDGKHGRAGSVAQIGISLVGPDASADINNYTLWFVTDNEPLQSRLSAAGFRATFEKDLLYDLESTDVYGGELTVVSGTAATPAFDVKSEVVLPTGDPTTFTASWWTESKGTPVRARTVFPAIRFGSAASTLSTPRRSSLAGLLGATELSFPVLDSYNVFADANLEVRSDGAHRRRSGRSR